MDWIRIQFYFIIALFRTVKILLILKTRMIAQPDWKCYIKTGSTLIDTFSSIFSIVGNGTLRSYTSADVGGHNIPSNSSSSIDRRSPKMCRKSRTTPLVQPNPNWTSYSPPPPGNPMTVTSYYEKKKLNSNSFECKLKMTLESRRKRKGLIRIVRKYGIVMENLRET